MTEAPALTTRASGSWEANADFWIEIIRQRRDRYRTELTDAAVLAAIGDCTGLDVLDVGCGEGYLTRELARRGAQHVHGIDKSAALIKAAQDTATPGTAFDEGDVTELSSGDESRDLIVANHLLNDLPDITSPILEFARVLRPGGRLVALMLHPCFYGDRAETTPLQDLPAVESYFRQRAVTQTFEVDGLTSPLPSTSWVRPLEAYTGALVGAGLYIASLSEPHPSPEQVASSQWWRDNYPRPLFMLLTAVKPHALAQAAMDVRRRADRAGGEPR